LIGSDTARFFRQLVCGGPAPAGRLWDTLIAARVLSNEAPLVVFESKYRGIVETMSEWMIDPVELPEYETSELIRQHF
jgi:hypothetical protein